MGTSCIISIFSSLNVNTNNLVTCVIHHLPAMFIIMASNALIVVTVLNNLAVRLLRYMEKL